MSLLLGAELAATITLFSNGELDTLSFRKGDERLVVSNYKDVSHARCKRVTVGVFHVNNIESTDVTFTVGDGSNTSTIATAGDIDKIAAIKLDEIDNLSGLDVNLYRVVYFNERVWVANSATVVSDGVGDPLRAKLNFLDLAELILCLLSSDTVNGKAALHVVYQTKMLVGLFNRNNIHETSGKSDVSANLAVDLDQALHADGTDFLQGKGILQAVSEKDDKR